MIINMKRKSTDNSATAVEFSKKNVRSKIPRKKREHISPILFNFADSNAASLKRNVSFNSTCDEVSCNTTVESAALPPNAAFRCGNEAVSKPLKKLVSQVSVSENSCVESCSVVAAEAESKRNDVVQVESSKVSESPANTTATVEQKTTNSSCDSGNYILGYITTDLACTENFSYDDYEVSSATNVSEFDSGVEEEEVTSELEDFSDEFTPSIWLDSGSQFSEKSFDGSTPSPCYSLFKEFSQQLLKMSCDSFNDEVSSLFDDHYSDELAFWRFEVEEDEESYRMLRSRERNQAVKVKDYVEEYNFATDFGGLIVEQRMIMVDWIIKLSEKKDLQKETLFLGVRLLDRFLSKGYFTSRRNLQILGIACFTLAIRIEENQPYNSVRQKSFYVGSNVYSRYEVVAMEWVVLEVLNFHCFSPTIYNFLWFYLIAATADEEMQGKANYLAAVSLLDHRHLNHWPSTVAAALVILVATAANREESILRVMEEWGGCLNLEAQAKKALLSLLKEAKTEGCTAHVRTKVDDLPECMKDLEWLVEYAN